MVMEEYDGELAQGQESAGGFRFRALGTWSLSGMNPGLFVGLLLVFLSGSVLACGSADGRLPALDPDVMTFLGNGSLQVSAVTPGLVHYDIRTVEVPWAVQLLRVDLSRCELGLQVLEAPVEDGAGEGRSTVSDLVRGAGQAVVAAVNGDFFTPEGRPLGTEVVSGVTRQIRNRPTLAWRPGASPWVGIAERGSETGLSLGTSPDSQPGPLATQAIGGFPLLLQDGNRLGDLEVSRRPGFAAERHPRTAVGFDADGPVLWILVVDGRQPDYSAGMTLPELAGLLEALGVEEAINLDGGGSTSMIVAGETVNQPSDAEGERPVVNALGIRMDPALCPVRE